MYDPTASRDRPEYLRPMRQPVGRHERRRPRSARRATWREDLITGLCSLLLVLGLYLDGWNHINLQADELGAFLTPWHGVLYAGFTAAALWVLKLHQRRGSWSLAAVPPGYRAALVGMALSMVALAGDAAWHTLFGEEKGVTRMIAPFHLFLFAGASLLVSSGLRAGWSAPTSAKVPSLRAFLPVLTSTTLITAMTAFFFQYVSPVVAWRRPAQVALPAASPFLESMQILDLLGVLVHNLLFIAPILLLLRRWRPPLGAMTIMSGSVALLLSTQTELRLVGLVGAAVLGGAAADVAIALARPSPVKPWATRTVAMVAPLVYWTANFAILRVGYGMTWVLEIWLGAVVWASLSGLVLAVLMQPAAIPLTAWNRSGSSNSQRQRPGQGQSRVA